ncbi:MAG: STAS/SEC14 domain-containing protein [Marinilabiliaceae bacterium]|nr:STAS/SEC14 domain-containing protein [Marinilabiliaceae bacterium]
MKVKWIEKNGKRILYADYRGLTTKEMIQQLEQEAQIMLNENKKVLYLGNFQDTIIEKEFMARANELGKKIEPLNEKSAIVGVKGMKKVILNTYNLLTRGNIKTFDSEDEAFAYLMN